MGRALIYASSAEKQKAYRERKKRGEVDDRRAAPGRMSTHPDDFSRQRKTLSVLMRTLPLLPPKTAALVQKAADDRDSANPHEKRMALAALIRKGLL